MVHLIPGKVKSKISITRSSRCIGGYAMKRYFISFITAESGARHRLRSTLTN